MKTLLKLAFLAALVFSALPAFATNWYIRSDGGTRFDANVPTGQCNGKADAAYPGSGTNQPCALKDLRFLWDDQTTTGLNVWAIAGGDVVLIRGCASTPTTTAPDCGIGFQTQNSTPNVWCLGGSGNASCYNPAIPAGTAGAHTKFLGANFASCSAKSSMQRIVGNWGVGTTFNVTGTQYVDFECIQLTRQSNCIFFGSPANPPACNRSYPTEDNYADNGIVTGNTTANVLFQDMWIHGFLGRGIKGPIGGPVTCLRCDIDTNGGAGWDFDDGSATPMGAGAIWNFLYSIIEWSGCNQEYPFVHAIPVASCYSQSTGGYGDAVGTPAGTGLSVSVDHSTFIYNTQDGMDLGHVDTGGPYTLSVTNSFFAHNGGSNGPKFDNRFGSVSSPGVVTGNLILGDCSRMAAPITGAPNTYNTNLSDFCRAGDNFPFNFDLNTLDVVANNTVIGYASTNYDWSCNNASPCPLAKLEHYNNIVLGYANLGAPCGPCSPGFANNPGSNYGGTNIGPSLIFRQNGGPGILDSQNNIYFQLRQTCPTGFDNGTCGSPLLAGMPSGNGVTFVEGELDVFGTNAPIQSAWQLAGGSPALAAGITYTQLPSVDLFGNAVSSPNPVIGAVNPSTPPPVSFSGSVTLSGSVTIP